MRKTLLGLFVVILLGSCATYHGALSSNAVIVDNNFKIVGLAVGESQSTRVLGLGGFNKEAMVFEAKRDLYRQVKLLPGQALTNITVDFKNEFFGVYSRHKVTVTAEIIDFSSSVKGVDNEYDIRNRNGFELGEMIFTLVREEYQKREIKALGISSLSVESHPGDVKSTWLSVRYEDSYKLSGSFIYDGVQYSVGDHIKLDRVSDHSQELNTFVGTVVGLNHSFALLLGDGKEKFKRISISR